MVCVSQTAALFCKTDYFALWNKLLTLLVSYTTVTTTCGSHYSSVALSVSLLTWCRASQTHHTSSVSPTTHLFMSPTARLLFMSPITYLLLLGFRYSPDNLSHESDNRPVFLWVILLICCFVRKTTHQVFRKLDYIHLLLCEAKCILVALFVRLHTCFSVGQIILTCRSVSRTILT